MIVYSIHENNSPYPASDDRVIMTDHPLVFVVADYSGESEDRLFFKLSNSGVQVVYSIEEYKVFLDIMVSKYNGKSATFLEHLRKGIAKIKQEHVDI